MTLKDQPSVESPRVPLASSSRVSWSLFLLLVTIPLLFLLHILVLRYSCIAPAWTVAIESDSQDELKPVGGVAAMIDVIGPLSDLRGSMGDSETDLGVMEEADAPRKMEEAEPAPRWMEEAELSRRKEEAEPPRGMVDAERSADRLQYPGRKRVVGLVGGGNNDTPGSAGLSPGTGGAHRRSPQEERTGGAHRRSPQEERTGGAHRRSAQEERTGGAHRRSAQEERTGGAHRRSPQEERTGGAHRRSPQEEPTGGAHRRSTQEERTGGAHRRSAQEERTGGACQPRVNEEERSVLSLPPSPLRFTPHPPPHLGVSPSQPRVEAATRWLVVFGFGHGRSEVNEEERSVLSLPPFPSPALPPHLGVNPSPGVEAATWLAIWFIIGHGRIPIDVLDVLDVLVEAEAGRVFRFIIGNECSAEDEERCPALPILPPSSPLPPHYTHFSLEAEAGLVFRFIIGHGTSAEEEEQLQVENSTHGDLLRIDVDEADFNANRKALVYFTSLFKLYEAEFYVKADDDIYLIPDRLASLVAMPRKSPRTYLGCFKNGAVVTNPDMSEFEPNSRLLGPQYFLHAYSNIYSLSYGVVKILNSVPNGR
ncbi:unnamed protein product [Closterium sp. NIES-64]|nr:unnamed protein product [Closterium sp. NIES-64]